MSLCYAEQDPTKELVVVGRLASNLLALVNDPTGSGHMANVITVEAWSPDTMELFILLFTGPEGVKKGDELWLDYGPVNLLLQESLV